MPIVFTAITPHSPVLLPNIGKDNIGRLDKTVKALKDLERDLYASKPDAIVVLSPHTQSVSDSFSINLHDQFKAKFDTFGDMSTELSFRGDPISVQKIRVGNESNQYAPLALVSQPVIDYGTAVPLFYLTKHMENIPIIPIGYSSLDNNAHYKFGEFLHHQLYEIDKRFAVIASGDLSHGLPEEEVDQNKTDQGTFDDQLIRNIKENNIADILAFDEKFIQNSGECGLKPILMLMGLLHSTSFKTEIVSYEHPFGVGYLVANLSLV